MSSETYPVIYSTLETPSPRKNLSFVRLSIDLELEPQLDALIPRIRISLYLILLSSLIVLIALVVSIHLSIPLLTLFHQVPVIDPWNFLAFTTIDPYTAGSHPCFKLKSRVINLKLARTVWSEQ